MYSCTPKAFLDHGLSRLGRQLPPFWGAKNAAGEVGDTYYLLSMVFVLSVCFALSATRRFMNNMGLTSLPPGVFDPLVALTQL